MLGKYKAVLALLLLIILVPLTLLMTLGLWVPTLAGILLCGAVSWTVRLVNFIF